MSVVRETARWLGRLVLSLYLSTLLVFAAIEISIDGGMAAVVLGAEQGVVDLDDEAYAAVRPGTQALVETFHLRDPIPVRHARWFADAARGDLGRSIRDQPVDTLMTPRLPISAQIAFAGLAIALVLGVAAGLIGALLTRPGPRLTHAVVTATLQATPAFLLATFGVWFFAVRLGWLPAAGWERLSAGLGPNLRNLLLPLAAVALPEAGMIARIVMTSTQQVLDEEYVIAATAKGLPRRQVFLRHVMRPASMTLLTQVGLIFGSMLGGVVIVERLFGIGGLGSVLFEGSINRDTHVVAAITAYITAVIVAVRALSDATYRWADPRLR